MTATIRTGTLVGRDVIAGCVATRSRAAVTAVGTRLHRCRIVVPAVRRELVVDQV
jgi:hypothetical protein